MLFRSGAIWRLVGGLFPSHDKGCRQLEPCGCMGRMEIMSAWVKEGVLLGGVSRVTSVAWESALYIANYILKADIDRQGYRGKELPFQLMSKGLGKGYLDKDAVAMRQRLSVTVGGQPVALPRYYLRRLDEFWPGTKEDAASRENEAPPSKVAGIWHGDIMHGRREVEGEIVLPRLARERDALAKKRMFQKGVM